MVVATPTEPTTVRGLKAKTACFVNWGFYPFNGTLIVEMSFWDSLTQDADPEGIASTNQRFLKQPCSLGKTPLVGGSLWDESASKNDQFKRGCDPQEKLFLRR